ncbi:HYALURONAN/mRNA BINDING FAMILY PROTEIN [Hibiscus trionum]|uniref:HYALURONAN/mRNA BINDING FAMILY PROTEIN n=1 Tax=Hibiscus trionum TaxID=183268 RepID=A0A9W7J1K1_HIBTR|nr:HYALURONAN/mRNA BINDING FAMILY PROTEIN [Hibiscus trionum]
MATMNPFDLLDDDTEDPSLLLAAVEQQKLEKPKKAPASGPTQPGKAAKLPSKPLPPAQAVREAKNEPGRGGGRGTDRGRGRVGGGYNRDSNFSDNSNGFSGVRRPSEEGEGEKQVERRGYGGPRGSFRGGRRGGFSSGEGERPRRQYDRVSGTGHGNEFKRDGAGRGNWGSPADEVAPETEENVPKDEKNVSFEKQPGEEDAADANKENAANEAEEKEPETKEMTLEEYEKILEEKRKALLALKTEERKVDVKEFESMQQLSNKKSNDDIFIKLGSEKDKRKDAEKEEKIKKAVSINEFLKPAEGERYYGPGRGRGRGRGARGGYGGNTASNVPAPSIEDPGHFPSLGGK